MPRERNFSPADVLQAATALFTTHGYQGTSLAMLADATGVGKQSLYNSFGDKRALYLQSLDCAAAGHATVQSAMQAAPDGRAAIAIFFDGLVARCCSSDPAERSCVVSAGLLEGIDDPAVQRHLRAKWQASRELLRETVERGQKDGSIGNVLPSAVLADLLMNLMSGLRVSALADVGGSRLREVADLSLSLLDRPHPV